MPNKEVNSNNTLSENVLILVKQHGEVVEAAMADYYVDKNMIDEVRASQAKLLEGLKELVGKYPTPAGQQLFLDI